MSGPGSQGGFTIAETLITLLVFSVTIVSIIGIFGNILKIERTVFAVQSIQENALFVLELMAREIRVGQLCPLGGVCNSTTLTISHPINGTVIYSSSSGTVTRNAGGAATDISSADVNFTRLNFLISGLGVDCRQPRVTIVTSIQNKVGTVFKINLQTTVVSRDVREEFQNPISPCP